MTKTKLKKKAVKLRKKGLSYSEILDEVSVSKSTLSRWLRDVGLAERQKQRLTEKKLAASRRGAATRRRDRIERTKEIKKRARKEVDSITKRELWLLGIALYWTEGAKEKVYDGKTNSPRTKFGNSDERMVRIFLKWLEECCEVSKDRIYFRILVHENLKSQKKKVQNFWSEITGFPVDEFEKITWKKHKPKTNRKNTGKDYHGVLEIRVKKSTDLTRKIAGWVEGVCSSCRVV